MDPNDELIKKATIVTENIPYTWSFTPIADLHVNDQNLVLWMGNLKYEHPGYRIPMCLRVKSWKFTIEQNLQTQNEDLWVAGGFRNGNHYVFGTIDVSDSSEQGVIESFLDYCFEHFLPTLYPEKKGPFGTFINIHYHPVQASADVVKPDLNKNKTLSEN